MVVYYDIKRRPETLLVYVNAFTLNYVRSAVINKYIDRLDTVHMEHGEVTTGLPRVLRMGGLAT